jgi:hypothetical protein
MASTNEPVYSVVWPKSPRAVQGRLPAARLDSLTGKRVAFVWDYLFRGEELFPVLESTLRERYDVEVLGYDTFGNIHGSNEQAIVAGLADALRRHRVDAVVVGNGC